MDQSSQAESLARPTDTAGRRLQFSGLDTAALIARFKADFREGRRSDQRGFWRLSQSVYHRKILERELAEIFPYYPAPICALSELSQVGAFATTCISGLAILAIRGEDMRVRLFLNSCRHRGHVLLDRRFGKVSCIRCPYHGWSYQLSGTLQETGDECKLSALGLIQLKSQELLGMVWLVGQGGPVIDPHWVEAIREHRQIHYFTQTCDANWKVLVESNLEVDHVQTVHRDTLAKTSIGKFMACDEFENGLRITIPMRSLLGAFQGKSEPEWQRHVSIAHLIFPSTIYLNVAQKYAVLLRFEPLSSSRTRLDCWIFAPDKKTGFRQARRDQAISEFVNRFIAEDLNAAENVQRTMSENYFGELSLFSCDRAIVAFHTRVLAHLRINEMLCYAQ